MKIFVSIRDKVGGNFRVEEIKRIEKISELDVERIARECEKIIGETITRKAKHSTGYLASFFYAHPFNNGAIHGWAVGDIAELDKEAKYWNHCLSPYTEVYIEQDNLIVPKFLKDVLVLWQNNKNLRILTPNGLKKIQNIWNVSLDSYYAFNISYWYSVEMSGNHKLIYKLRNGFFEKTAESFGTAFGCYSTLFTTLESLNKYLISSVEINNEIIQLDYLLGWMLGIILAEGTFGLNRIEIPQKNIDKLACYVTEFCKQFDYLPQIQTNYTNNCDKLVIGNKRIDNIIRFFISGKSYNKQFDYFFLNSPIEFREGILDGYQIGDGRQSCINNFEVRTTSEVLRNQLILIGSSLGYDCSIWKDLWQENGPIKANYFIKGGNILNHCRKYNVKQFHCDKIGKDRVGLAKNRDSKGRILPQDYQIVNFDYFPKSITNIQRIDKKVNFIDLQVEDGLFLINGGIVSHNCDKGSEGIGANWSHWLPKGRWVDGRWVEDEAGYFAKPKTPIPAMQYISETLSLMEVAIPQILKG